MAVRTQGVALLFLFPFMKILMIYTCETICNGCFDCSTGSTDVFVSKRGNRGGQKIPADSFKPDANSFAVPVSDPISDQALGVIYISVEPEFLYKAIDNTRGTIPVAVTVIAPYETDMFYIGTKGTNESWLVGTTAHGYQVRVAVPKDYVWSGTLASSALILGLSASLSSFYI